MSHSILPPSGSDAWVNCPMWVTMNKNYPQNETEASSEGNAAHWVMNEMLSERTVKLGEPTPFNINITEEMLEGFDLVRKYLNEIHATNKWIHVEKTIECSSIHSECYGTPDLHYFNQPLNTLYIIDYKFGHRFIDEYENWQCVIYASGLVDKYIRALGISLHEIKVVITIIQPRCYIKGDSTRTWSIGSAANLIPLWDIARISAAEALSDKPKSKTGKHCKYCPGRHTCSVLQEDAYLSADIAKQSIPVEINTSAASLELKMLESTLGLLEARIEGLKEFVSSRIKQGDRAPFHAIEHIAGKGRDWNLSTAEIIALGGLFDVDLSKLTTVTPNQAIKLGLPKDFIESNTTVKKGSSKLVETNFKNVKRIFGD